MPTTPTTRQSQYLRYLPGIYQGAGTALPQFLLPFEEQFADFEALLSIVDNYMAPGLTPAAEFLPWLASWVALTLDEEWEELTRRRLLCEAVELYRWRGTAHGLRRYLELYTRLPQEQIEIHEARWPGGMQIGVASRIGGFAGGAAPPGAVKQVRRREPAVYHDYYVVDTPAPAGHAHVRRWTADAVVYGCSAGDARGHGCHGRAHLAARQQRSRRRTRWGRSHGAIN